MRNFKRLVIWQRGMDIVTMVYWLDDSFAELVGSQLIDQLRNVAISIPSTIAIGSSAESDSEYIASLRSALGGCFQLETLLTIVETLPVAGGETLQELIKAVEEEKQLLMNFMRQLILKGM